MARLTLYRIRISNHKIANYSHTHTRKEAFICVYFNVELCLLSDASFLVHAGSTHCLNKISGHKSVKYFSIDIGGPHFFNPPPPPSKYKLLLKFALHVIAVPVTRISLGKYQKSRVHVFYIWYKIYPLLFFVASVLNDREKKGCSSEYSKNQHFTQIVVYVYA